MKKTKPRFTCILSVLMALCMFTSAISTASAAENTIQPRYQRICFFTADLDISSSGRATCYGCVVPWDSTDVVDLTVELQRTTYGGTWTTIKTWTGSGSGTISVDKDWYVASGYYYQVCVTADLYTADGTFVEGISEYSVVIQY